MVGSIKKPGTYEKVKVVSGVVGRGGGGVYAPTGENISAGEITEEQAKQILEEQIKIRQAGGTGYVPEGGYLSMYKEVPEVPVGQGSRTQLSQARVGTRQEYINQQEKLMEQERQRSLSKDYNSYMLNPFVQKYVSAPDEQGVRMTYKEKEIPQISKDTSGNIYLQYKSGEKILIDQIYSKAPDYVNNLEVQPAQTTKQRIISYFKPEGEKFSAGTILSAPVRTIKAISGELQRLEDIRQQKMNDFYQSESMLTIAEKLPYASYFTQAGSVLIASSGAERLTTPLGKQQLNQIGNYLESKGLPSSLKYTVPIGEIGLGAIGIRSQLKTLSNIKEIAQNTPIGEITTKTISTNRQAVSNIITSNKELSVMLKNERISGSRIYETSIPVKEGTKRILWIEQSSAKGGVEGIGRRKLVGVEISPTGEVTAKLSGGSIEQANEKGVNILTQIVRETKGKRLILSPTEERQLLTYAEEIKPVAVRNIGKNIRATISQSESSLIGQENVLGLVRKELEAKKNLFFEGSNFPIKPESGVKSIMKEVTLLEQPNLVIAKQKFGIGQVLSIRAEQKGISIGVEEAIKKPIKISIKSIPSKTISDTSQVTKQITKQVTQLGKPSGFAQAFAQTKVIKEITPITPITRTSIKVVTEELKPQIKVKPIESTKLGENIFSGITPSGRIESLSVETKDLGVLSSKFDILTKATQKEGIKQQTKQGQELLQLPKQEELQLQQPKQEQQLLQKQIQLQKQLQKQIQLQKLKSKLTSRFKQPKPTKPKLPPPPFIPKLDLGKAFSKLKSMDEDEFEAIGIRFGKEISLKKGTKTQAEEELSGFLSTTLGASGFLKKGQTKLKAEETGLLRKGFIKSKINPFKVVERRERRLKKGGSEVREIKYFKKR